MRQDCEESQNYKQNTTPSEEIIQDQQEIAVVDSIKERIPWQSYENSRYELPFQPLSQSTSYYMYRWRVWSPLHKRIIFGWTVGEILTLLLMLAYPAITMPITYCNPCEKQNSNGQQNKLYTKSGTVATIPLLLCFLFATRNSIWTFLFGITFERQLIWHKILAVITLGMTLYHGILSVFNITGWITFGCISGLVIFSLPPIRRKVFEFFYRTHWILFILLAIFGIIHGAGIGIIGFAGNIIDFILRTIIVVRNKKIAFVVLAVKLPTNVIRITFNKKSFEYKSGQYAFICVPELSHLEWHPFSISSSPHHENVSFHIRVLGDWTRRLEAIVGTTEKKLVVWIDGSYGNPSIDIDSDKYKIFLMVSGGIGITPLQSITNSLLEQHSRGRPLKKLFFIWSVRDHALISDIQSYDMQYLEKKLPQKLPIQFQPDVLDSDNRRNYPLPDMNIVLDSRFHLTQLKEVNESQLQHYNIVPEKMPYLKFGRPNMQKIFEEVQLKAIQLGESRVGVLCCGPSGLMEDIISISKSTKPIEKDAVVDANFTSVQFDVHDELFEF